MSENAKHTPIPWRVDPSFPHDVQSESGLEIATVNPEVMTGGKKPKDASEVVENAEFIVRAVNSHDALLEMLYEALPSVEEADKFNKPWKKLGPRVRALLSKAEKGA